MEKNILRKHNFLAEVTFKDQNIILEEDLKISEISEFSILGIGQNRKLGNPGKCSFTSNFDSTCNLRCKNDKKITETKT